jgi:hypothetical protein
MQSNKWGKHAWEFSHYITFNYPIEPTQHDKESCRTYFENLKNILPCSICKNSYIFFYDNFPIDDYLNDRNGVVYWLYTIHNMVNYKLNNKSISFKSVILKYENNRARCGNINTKDTKKLKECQTLLNWNDEMENFYNKTIDKYETVTIKKILMLIKKNKKRQEIIDIILNLNNYFDETGYLDTAYA